MTSLDVDDIIDDQIETPKQQMRISPSSSQASLSKKIISNYKSQSLQSMNVLLNSGNIGGKDSRHKSSGFKSSDHLNHQRSIMSTGNSHKKNDNFSINLVTSEEECDDEQEHHSNDIQISEHMNVKNCENYVVVNKFVYDNNSEQHNIGKKEKRGN